MAAPLSQTELLRQQNAAGLLPSNLPTLPTSVGNYDPFKAAVQLGSGNQAYNPPNQAPLPSLNAAVPAVPPVPGVNPLNAPKITPAANGKISTAGMDWSQVTPTQFAQLKIADPATFGALPSLAAAQTGGATSPNAVAPVSTGGPRNTAPVAANAPQENLGARSGFGNDVEVIRGGQVVPQTTNWSATPGSVPGGFVDPRAAIATGYDQQVAYRNQGLQDIMAAARQGDPNNYSFRLARLVDAIGPNNFGAVQGAGTNSLNGALAGITSAGISANANIYGADVNAATQAAALGERHYETATSSVPTGTTLGRDPVTGFAIPLTSYGQRPTAIGGMPTPYTPAQTALPSGLKVGASSKQPDGQYSAGGKTVTIKDGKVSGIE